MDIQDNNEYEIIDAKSGKLAKLGNDTKLFIGNMVDKIVEIPNFAKEVLKSFDKSEEKYNEMAKQDKKIIELVIERKLESGNYTDEELNNLLDRTEKITEKSGGFFEKLNKHKSEMLMVVVGAMVTVLKIMIENRNNKS
jgi:hypothetical protein